MNDKFSDNTYYGAASEILPNDQVEQKILSPKIREKLKALYKGPGQQALPCIHRAPLENEDEYRLLLIC